MRNGLGWPAAGQAKRVVHELVAPRLKKRRHLINKPLLSVPGSNTALHVAALYKQSELVRQLLANGATCDAKASNCATPLHSASDASSNFVLPSSDAATCVGLLIEHGAEVNADCDGQGVTPVIIAAQTANLPALKALVAAGADLDVQRASDGSTALHMAAGKGFPEACQLLCDAGADQSITNGHGITALQLGAAQGMPVCVRFMLLAGANAAFAAPGHGTALDLATTYPGPGSAECVALLTRHAASRGVWSRDHSLLALQSTQYLCVGGLALLSPGTLLDLFEVGATRGDRPAWETFEATLLLHILGVALLTLGFLAGRLAWSAGRDVAPSSRRKVALCSLVLFLPGLLDTLFTHKISKRRYFLSSIVGSDYPRRALALLYAANVVAVVAANAVTRPQTQAVVGRGGKRGAIAAIVVLEFGALAACLIPKPAHSAFISALPGVAAPAFFATPQCRVVAIWVGFCCAALCFCGGTTLAVSSSSNMKGAQRLFLDAAVAGSAGLVLLEAVSRGAAAASMLSSPSVWLCVCNTLIVGMVNYMSSGKKKDKGD